MEISGSRPFCWYFVGMRRTNVHDKFRYSRTTELSR
jgi:hypothetical protein